MSLTCPRCAEFNPSNATHCGDCGTKLALFPVNTRCCAECGDSLRGRHLLVRFCSPSHRKRHWARRHPRTQRA